MKRRLLYFSILLVGMLQHSCQCTKNKTVGGVSNKKVEEAPKHNSPDQHEVDSIKNSYNKHPK
ncbi:MAG: hypothetical protein IPK91_10225 [Saprospiraceae bacterium]|jgi:hypothetical protein|nr:hypothetical protein [Saprospiraceae bacterium]MBK8297633.1 hypothetical protein [Saprospiraceae bacterium]